MGSYGPKLLFSCGDGNGTAPQSGGDLLLRLDQTACDQRDGSAGKTANDLVNDAGHDLDDVGGAASKHLVNGFHTLAVVCEKTLDESPMAYKRPLTKVSS